MLKNQISTKKPFVCPQRNINTMHNKHTLNNNIKRQQKQVKPIGSILQGDQICKSASKFELKDQSQNRLKGHSKIKQIGQLINANSCHNIKRQDKKFCTTKSINLNNIENMMKNKSKKKLQVSLSKQKIQNRERSASERSANKGIKLKVSLNNNFTHNKQKSNLIRKIKDFQISNEQKQQINKARTARMIKNIQNCPISQNITMTNCMKDHYQSNPHPQLQFQQNLQIRKEQKTKQHKAASTISITINMNNEEQGIFQRRKIRLHRNR